MRKMLLMLLAGTMLSVCGFAEDAIPRSDTPELNADTALAQLLRRRRFRRRPVAVQPVETAEDVAPAEEVAPATEPAPAAPPAPPAKPAPPKPAEKPAPEKPAEKPAPPKPAPKPTPAKKPAVEKNAADKNVVTSGAKNTVRFAVAWSTNKNAAAAGKEATEAALKALGCPAKGVVFYTYYQDPKFTPDEKNQATACKSDVKAEKAAAAAVNKACKGVKNVGCRARCLTNGGTLLKNAVGVLAIGGDKTSIATCKVPIQDDRLKTGKDVAAAMKKVKDLKLILALAEMRLSFEAKEGVSVEDFIRGALSESPKGTTLFGGNSMPDDMASAGGMAGAQFKDGEMMKGHVVALGLGGPVDAFGNHTNEFDPSKDAPTVTETKDKWIVTLDGKPAEEVYRKLRGMKAEDELSSDWQHPIGVIIGDGKEYVRMVLNWVDKDGKDKDGEKVDAPTGSLCFVAPVVKGTKIRVFCGGDDGDKIVATAKKGVAETVAEVKKAGDKPALCLLSNCCARGMRLRTFGKKTDDEVDAIAPALGKNVPLFGFYAWGELGRIQGEYQKMDHQYQQHTFVSTILGMKK